MHKRTIGYLAVSFVLASLFLIIANFVNGGKVSEIERSVFISINHLPNWLYPIMQGLQYLGLLVMPAVFAIIFIIKKEYVVSILLLLIIPIKLFAENVSKAHFIRERPAVYIPDAILRGNVQASGLSFYSGHAFIITMIATIITPYVSKRWRIAIWLGVLGCVIARVYLGAHLPLDVLAGGLLGAMCGCLIHLVVYIIKRFTEKDQATSEQSNTN